MKGHRFIALAAAMALTPIISVSAADISDDKARLHALLELSPGDMPVLLDRAQSGDGVAMALLGESYALAFGGLHQDDKAAAQWLGKAVAAGQSWAAREAGFYAFRSDHAAGIASAEATLERARTALAAPAGRELEPDPELADLARQGLVEAQTLLARQLSSGRGARQDLSAAARWWSAAAETGDASADAALGRAFAQGEGVPRDPAASVEHYRRAAEMGDVDGQTALGALYAHGTDGLPVDEVEALKWLALAASHGGANAREGFANLAVIVGQDETRAALLRAARWTPVNPAGIR